MARRVVQEDTYARIKEGHNVLKIMEIEEDKDFNKLTIKVSDKSGTKDQIRYSFENSDGTPNTVSLSIYTKLAAKLLNLNAKDEFEDEDLLNKYFSADVYYNDGKPYISKSGKEVTPKYFNVRNVEPVSSFDGESSSEEIDTDFDDIQF